MRRDLLERWRPAVAGHWWTVGAELYDRVRPVVAPEARAWTTVLDDPRVGPVRLHGLLRERAGAGTLLLVVHGLGGSPMSPYCRRAAAGAERRGWSCLRLGLRGSTGDGEDIYHAGLGRDLAHALEDPTLRRYDRVLVVGYSLGGHVVLSLGLAPDPRVAAVAVVSAPLDLDRSCAAIDRRRGWVYRRHVLRGLVAGYRAVAARRPVATPVHDVARVRRLRDWDRLTVVPRFGFADAEDYYRRASVGPRLLELRVPALYVGMRHDPMVPQWTVVPSLEAAGAGASAGERLQAWWLDDGGHVAAPGRWEDDLLAWLDGQGPCGAR
jgi:predicted alpha/beta-fold hydrolase